MALVSRSWQWRTLVVIALVALAIAGRVAQAAPAQQGSATVRMLDFSFDPQTLTIPAGTTVNWPNAGQAPHTATSSTGIWDSGVINAGGTYSFTFNTAGTFPYYCTLHGTPDGTGMAGTIIVTAAQAQPTATTAPPPPTATTAPAPAAPTATTAPASEAPAAPTATTAPAAEAPAAPAAPAAPTAPQSALPTAGANGNNSWLVAALAVLVLAAGAGLRYERRRRTTS